MLKSDLYGSDPDTVGLGVAVISEVIADYNEGYQARAGDALSKAAGVSQVYSR